MASDRPKFTAGIGTSLTVTGNLLANSLFAYQDELPTITITGNAPLQNMVFSWSEPNGYILPVYSSDSKYVKYLDVDQSVDLTYTVIADVNAKPGLYQLNLVLKSDSVGGNSTSSTINTKAGIFIGGETDFDVAFSESSAGVTSLSVANIGNNPAQSVSVAIPNQQNFRVTGTSSSIVGNLDKGDYTIVSFQIAQAAAINFTGRGQAGAGNQAAGGQAGQGFVRQNSTAGNPNNLRVVIYYTDTTGQRQTVEKSVPINFRAAGTTTGSTGTGTSPGSFSRAR